MSDIFDSVRSGDLNAIEGLIDGDNGLVNSTIDSGDQQVLH